MRTQLSLLLGLLWPLTSTASIFNWPMPWSPPESKGVSSQPLSSLQPTIQSLIDRGEIPGAVVVVGLALRGWGVSCLAPKNSALY